MGRSHLTQITLPRLPRRQAAEMTDRVAHGKALPPEVVEQIVAKTDGVPLFVEELTKSVVESVGSVESVESESLCVSDSPDSIDSLDSIDSSYFLPFASR